MTAEMTAGAPRSGAPLLRPSWAQRPAQPEPYRWLATEPGELFAVGVAEELAECFPADGYTRLDTSSRARGKTYRNHSRVITADAASHDRAALPERWRALISELSSGAYRATVAGLLDQEAAAALELRLVRHSGGDWLGPHTDREDKLFSHIVYFNPGWRAEWGGCLEVLTGESGTAAARIVPRLGASALLVQAPNSWHQVTAVAPGAARERRSLLIHGLR
jgi:SM-20-related protein